MRLSHQIHVLRELEIIDFQKIPDIYRTLLVYFYPIFEDHFEVNFRKFCPQVWLVFQSTFLIKIGRVYSTVSKFSIANPFTEGTTYCNLLSYYVLSLTFSINEEGKSNLEQPSRKGWAVLDFCFFDISFLQLETLQGVPTLTQSHD